MKRTIIAAVLAFAASAASAVPIVCVTAPSRMNTCINPKAITVDTTGRLRAATLYMGADEITETKLRIVVECSGKTPINAWMRDAKGVNFAGAGPGTMSRDIRSLADDLCTAEKPKVDPKLKP